MPYVTLPNGDKMPMIGMGTFTGTRNTAKAQAGTMYENTKVCLRGHNRRCGCTTRLVESAHHV